MADKLKRILFVTSTRADFGKLKRLIEEVQNSREFEYRIFATGMHLNSLYDYTINEIWKAGFKRIFPYINHADTIDSSMDLALAKTVQGLGHYVRELPPDLIVVHGDRVETLAGAIVGALNNVLVAHIEGGEVSGTVDELMRHAVTKLSHLHFVANDEARMRLVQMGESEDYIFVIGSPDIDIMLSDRLPSLDQAKRRYGIEFTEYGIFAYHPVTTELHLLKRNIENVVNALKDSGWNFVVIYPNNDCGAKIILDAIIELSQDPHFRVFPSVRFEYFLTLLKHCKAIIGNSSAGVREAPVYGVPSINIGTRQMNRFHYASIINVSGDKEEILKAMRNLPAPTAPSLHFGHGNSAEAFMATLRKPEVWRTPRQKRFRDL